MKVQLPPRRGLIHVIMNLGPYSAKIYLFLPTVRSGSLRFNQILEIPNPELDLGSGPVLSEPPNLNWGPVRFGSGFNIGSEPDRGNTMNDDTKSSWRSS